MLDLELASGYRWFLGVTGTALFAVTALTTPAGVAVLGIRNAVPLGMAAVMLLGALYHERWRWNVERGRVEHRVGVGPAFHSRYWPLSEVRSLRLGGVLITLPAEAGRRPLPVRLMRFVERRRDLELKPPAMLTADLRAGGPARGPRESPSWWTARARSGEVEAGFSRAEFQRARRDREGPASLLNRVGDLLVELRGLQAVES